MSDQLSKVAESSLTKLENKMPPEEFLQFLRENIAVEDLLQSRKAQAAIARIMSDYFRPDKETVARYKERGILQIMNPYPVLELESESGSSIFFIHTAFMLQDQQYYYYFPSWNPRDEVPSYLRPKDVVPSKTSTPTYPPDVKASIMKDLKINTEQFRYLVYIQDSRVTDHAVMQDIPFNKPFCRVDINGGEAERFNYNTGSWEQSGQGRYSSSLGQKLRAKLTKSQ